MPFSLALLKEVNTSVKKDYKLTIKIEAYVLENNS